MNVQVVTAELREWIVAQATAGHSSESVLEAMKASGWDEDTAIQALETTMIDHVSRLPAAGGAGREGREGRSLRSMPAANEAIGRPMPGASVSASAPRLDAGDRTVDVLAALDTPRIVVFGNLLSAQECAEMIELARARLARSETVEIRTGATEVNEARTSDGMFFERGEVEVCARFEARVAALLGWPLENGEGLQILRYGPGAEYKPHYDYFDPAEPGTPVILQRGGQRVASLVCYLNTPEAGGATVFPDIGLEVAPVCGNAVFFSYDRPHPATRSLHGGAPVTAGEKWVATKWLRESRFD